MNIGQYNNLLELFYNQFKNEKIDQVFLQSLKNSNLKYTWQDTYINVLKLAYEIEMIIKKMIVVY